MMQLSEKFFYYLFLLVPLFLITGPALPDIVITLGLIFGIIYFIYYKEYSELIKINFIKISVIFWLSLIFISFFSYNKTNSFQDALIFIRYIIFAIAISHWLIKDKIILAFFLKIFTLTIIFVVFDCLFQFINYNSLEGYGKDVFGFTSTHYGRLSGPFNDDVPGSHISRFIFFVVLLFCIVKNNAFFNNFTFIIIISLSLYVIWLSGEAMALATTTLGILIYICFIKTKKYLLIITSLLTLFMIFMTNKFHIMNYDYQIISSKPYHHGLTISKFGFIPP